MSSEDPEVLKRRLKKALVLAEKLKKKNHFEGEVNKELAKRNELLKRDLSDAESKINTIKQNVTNLDEKLQRVFIIVDTVDHEFAAQVKDAKDAVDELKSLLYIKPTSSKIVAGSKSKSSRRQSSLFINLPELSGTSLLRKSCEVIDGTMASINKSQELTKHLRKATISLGATVLGKHGEIVDNSINDHNQQEEMHEGEHAESDNKIIETTRFINNSDIIVDAADLLEGWAPLFEHFLVVGTPAEVATEFAQQLHAHEEGSISNRLLRTLGGLLGTASPRYNPSALPVTTAITTSTTTNNPGATTLTKNEKSSSYFMGSGSKTVTATALNNDARVERVDSVDQTQNKSSSVTPVPQSGTNNNNSSSVIQPSPSKSFFSYFTRTSTTSLPPNIKVSANTSTASASIVNNAQPHTVGEGSISNQHSDDGVTDSHEINTEHSVSTRYSTPDLKHNMSDLISAQQCDNFVASVPSEDPEDKTKSESEVVIPESDEGNKDEDEVEIALNESMEAPAVMRTPSTNTPVSGNAGSISGIVASGSAIANSAAGSMSRLGGAVLSRFNSANLSQLNEKEQGKQSSSSNTTTNTITTNLHSAANVASNLTANISSTVSSATKIPNIMPPMFGRPRSNSNEISVPLEINTALNKDTISQQSSPAKSTISNTELFSKDTTAPKSLASASKSSTDLVGMGVEPVAVPVSTTTTTASATSQVVSNNVAPASTNNPAPNVICPPIASPSSLILHSDKKLGHATTEATILYRYPPGVEPPPLEVCDFCLPLGGKIQRLSQKDEDTMVQEILFGHSHSKRSARCFIFLLEDKTIEDGVADEEAGVDTGKLYGICVIHPRLLKTPVLNNAHTNKKNTPNEQNKAHVFSDSEFIEFESSVCYAFITRFPLFEFFFQVIFDMITSERLIRMEMAVDQSDSDLKFSRNIYQYLPRTVLEESLERLTRIKPPRYGEKVTFQMSNSIQTIEKIREMPQGDFPEHYVNAAQWALPTLLSWMPIETLVWALGLLMCEAKIIVVGNESGMVSCAVMGLLVLLRPLDWVAPLIPMLPTKFMDFIEAPVPIIAGLTLDSDNKSLDVNKLLEKSDDADGTILAVLDVTQRELFISPIYYTQLSQLCLPDSEELISRVKEVFTHQQEDLTSGIDHMNRQQSIAVSNSNNNNNSLTARTRPLYSISPAQKADTRNVHEVVTAHLTAVVNLAIETEQNLANERAAVFERAQKLAEQAKHSNSNSNNNSRRNSNNNKPTTSLSFSDTDDESDEDDNENINSNALMAYYSNIVNDASEVNTPAEKSDTQHSSHHTNKLPPVPSSAIHEDDFRKVSEDEVTPVKPPKPPKPLKTESTNTMASASSTTSETNKTVQIPTKEQQQQQQQGRKNKSNSITSQNSSMNLSSGVIVNMNQPIRLSRETMIDSDEDGFLKRFIGTQMFSEYMNAKRNEDLLLDDTGEISTSEDEFGRPSNVSTLSTTTPGYNDSSNNKKKKHHKVNVSDNISYVDATTTSDNIHFPTQDMEYDDSAEIEDENGVKYRRTKSMPIMQAKVTTSNPKVSYNRRSSLKLTADHKLKLSLNNDEEIVISTDHSDNASSSNIHDVKYHAKTIHVTQSLHNTNNNERKSINLPVETIKPGSSTSLIDENRRKSYDSSFSHIEKNNNESKSIEHPIDTTTDSSVRMYTSDSFTDEAIHDGAINNSNNNNNESVVKSLFRSVTPMSESSHLPAVNDTNKPTNIEGSD